MAKIGSAPNGEKTSLDGTEKIPLTGNKYALISRLVAYLTGEGTLATVSYVNGIAANLGKRMRVRVATTANITISTALNNGDTLDGVALVTGDLVLVKNQSSAAQNGVYVVGASPARFAEFDSYDEHPGSLIAVQEGTANADTTWLCTSNVGGTLNTTAIDFSSSGSGGSISVQEQDGTPNVSGVTTIKVTNGKLTDEGGGVVSLDLSGGGGGGGGSSIPVDITDCGVWLEASNISGLSDGDPIPDFWDDLSGQAHPFTTYGSPLYKATVAPNSKPAVRIASGSTQYLRGWSPHLMPSWCWVFVFKISSLVPSYSSLLSYNPYTDSGGFLIKSNGKLAEYFPGSVYDGSGSVTLNTTDWNYIIINHKQSVLDVRRNGAADISGASYTPGSGNWLTDIGNHPTASRLLSADIALAAAFTRYLTAAEITALESYITTEYSGI